MIFFMCSSSERSVNYATKMERMLLSSTCEEQRSVVPFLWTKRHSIACVKFNRDMCGVYGEDLWTVPTSLGGSHHLETLLQTIRCSPCTPHVSMCPLAHKNRTRPSLRCSSHVNYSNIMCHLCYSSHFSRYSCT